MDRGLDRIASRRAQARRAILDSAWQLSAGHGLEALSLREIAESLGMRAPSLYSYFASKAAILDALFVDGYQAMNEQIGAVRAALPPRADARRRLIDLLHAWILFCQTDPARYRLLFTYAVPGWKPSAEAYEASVANYALLLGYLADAGVTDAGDADLCTALAAGLIAQQMANDPDGDRWLRRVDEVVDMFLRHTKSRRRRDARHMEDD